MAAKLLASSVRGKVVIVPLLLVALSLNFVVLELGIFVFIGFLVAKLNCYRFANSMMRLITLLK